MLTRKDLDKSCIFSQPYAEYKIEYEWLVSHLDRFRFHYGTRAYIDLIETNSDYELKRKAL